MAATTLPTVKQCTDPASGMFGAVAVQSAGNSWAVIDPASRGHWVTDSEVADWPELAAP